MEPSLKRLVKGTILEDPSRFAWNLVSAPKNTLYDVETKAVMRRVISRGSVCVDVGSHKGDFLRTMLLLAPEGSCYAFEPLPEMSEQLRRSFPGVTVHELALSDREGSVNFFRNIRRPGCSSLKPPISEPSEKLIVRTARLDDLLDRADFLKVDVEGAELQVFRGAERILSQRPFIVFEHGVGGADRYGTRPSDLYGYLREFDLRISLMWRWLAHSHALTLAAFERAFYAGTYCFLAHP